MTLLLWCYHYKVIVIEYELDSLIIDFNTSSTGMVWVPVKMVRSAANRQGMSENFIVSGEWSPWKLMLLNVAEFADNYWKMAANANKAIKYYLS